MTPMTLPPKPRPLNEAYTAQDVQNAAVVRDWLDTHNKSRSWLARKAGVPNGTLSGILSGKYVSSPTKQLAVMLSVLKVEEERLRDGTPGYVPGSVHRLMTVVYDRTRQHQNFGVITGHVGVGKTRFAKEYRASQPQTLLVEASPNMTAGVLLCDLLEMLNTAAPAGLDRKFREVVRVLRGTNFLIVVDEAERLSGAALEYLRRIRDMAAIGVVLQGTEKLGALIQPQHGQFDQIRSRVGMWPKTIATISQNDADDMARAALADRGELSDDVLATLWAYCAGSARVLIENLIPAVKDYGAEKALSAQLIEQIAAKVLFMEAPRAQGRKA